MIKIGFFVFGMTHIKNTTSYMHAFELVANRHKTLIPTYINVALASEFVILAGYLYYDPNIDNLFHLWMIIGIISYVIYVFVIPESPAWLVMKEGPNSLKAIETLNYIAWFNGSPHRIPQDTQLLIEKDFFNYSVFSNS